MIISTCPHCNKEICIEKLPQPTLRDQFAMAALTGILTAYPDSKCTPEEKCQDAYIYADAMIEARI